MTLEQARGMLVGLAVGDALGGPLEFGKRRSLTRLHTEMTGGGVFSLAPGEWTDDTAMALALGHAITERNEYDAYGVKLAWMNWYNHGYYSSRGRCFDIGLGTCRVIQAWNRGGRLPTLRGNIGNGSIMRLTPVMLWYSCEPSEAPAFAYAQAALTHSEQTACITRDFARVLQAACDGVKPLVPEGVTRDVVSNGGRCETTLQAAYWAIATTRTFEDALVQAVNLGGDADTIGAVTGQIAGALYGYSAIPERWVKALVAREEITKLAQRLYYREKYDGFVAALRNRQVRKSSRSAGHTVLCESSLLKEDEG